MNHAATCMLASAFVLAGCGGGQATTAIVDRPQPPAPSSFVSFSAITPDETVEATAISQSAVANLNTSGNVTSRGLGAVDADNGTVTLGYDASMQLSRITFANPAANITWSGSSQIDCSTAVCTTDNGAEVGGVVDAFAVGWDYQTLGFWVQQTVPTSAVFGVTSMGNPTPAANIPVSGTATYLGLSSGVYVDSAGVVFGYTSDMTATANFCTDSIAFSTSSSRIAPLGSTGSTAALTLDLTGTLTIQSGANAFTGTVTNPEGMTGSATGRFYGPQYEEIGGVFGLMQGSRQTLIGGFGGQRP